MAAVRKTRTQPSAPVAEPMGPSPIRVASAADTSVASPVQRLQAELEASVAEAPEFKRWPPAAMLLFAGGASAGLWWGVLAAGGVLLHAVRG